MSRPLDDLLRPTLGEEHDVSDVVAPHSPTTILYLTFFLGPGFGLILAWWNEPRCGLRRRPLLVGAYVLTLLALGVGAAAYVGVEPGESRFGTSQDETEVNARISALVERVVSDEELTEEEHREVAAEREAITNDLHEGDRSNADAAEQLSDSPEHEAWQERKTWFRIVCRALGVALVALLIAPQRRRVSIARSRGVETVPFWGPGIVALFVAAVLEVGVAVIAFIAWEIFV